MIVYVIKITQYSDGTDPDTVDIYGIYSSLAWAGHAVVQVIENADVLLTYSRFETSWGYFFQLYELRSGEKWQYGEIEIGRVTVNE